MQGPTPPPRVSLPQKPLIGGVGPAQLQAGADPGGLESPADGQLAVSLLLRRSTGKGPQLNFWKFIIFQSIEHAQDGGFNLSLFGRSCINP